MQIQHPLVGPLFLGVGILASLVNVLLLVLGFRIIKRKPEVNFALCLGFLDLVSPFLTVTIRGTYLLTGHDLRHEPDSCNVIGATNFASVFLSMLFVMLAAGERHSIVLRRTWGFGIKLLLVVHVSMYFALVLHGAAQELFILVPSGFLCSPVAQTSRLAAGLLCMIGFSLSLFLVVTLFCYIRILRIALVQHPDLKPGHHRRPVTLRTFGICFVYTLLVAPSGLLLMLKGTQVLPDSFAVNLLISLSLFSLTFANPALVIFSHSAFFDQIRHLFPSSKH